MIPTNQRVRTWPVLLALTACLGTAAAIDAQEPLTLRINDAEVRPGRMLALVLRTYASRQLGQGQVGAHASQALGEGVTAAPLDILATPLGAVVFSDAGDARDRFRVDTSSGEPILSLRFASPTASVNQSDGPMAVMYFRLPQDALPGTEFDVAVDPFDSLLIDEQGLPVPVAAAAGRVRVISPADRFGISASAEDTVPGEAAILSLQTSEVERLSSGQAVFRFNPDLFEGAPVVDIDPRYGNASWLVDDSLPGTVIVTFESADNSLNFVPGDIITVTLASRADIPPGTRTPIDLDPDLTFLVNGRGRDLPLEIEPGELIFP